MIIQLHVTSGNDSLNCIAVIGQAYLWKIGSGGHLVFKKLLKINTSQAYATLYPQFHIQCLMMIYW